jgi:hypothetical protein
MVHDDDAARTRGIGTGDEPEDARPPRDVRTRDLIVDTAQSNQTWGRIRICDELRARGHDVDQAEVDYVLDYYKLRR